MRASLAASVTAFLIVGSFFHGSVALGGTIEGMIADSLTQSPVEAVRVRALTAAGGTAAAALSDGLGRFRLGPLPTGDYAVVASRIGYERRRIGPIHLAGAESVIVAIDLAPGALLLNPVVVTASRRHEKSLDAPVSISVVGSRDIAERPALTPVTHVRAVAGIDVAAKGLTQYSVVARGFSSAQSSALLTLADYRYASIPSLRYNVFNFIPTVDEDMERIEIVRGPGAALYGPNSDRGVFHIVTKSPFDVQGTTVSWVAGERGTAQASFRRADLIGSRWGYKISAQYFRGRDWESLDSVEVAKRGARIAAGADPETLRVGSRVRDIERVGGEARLDWRPGSRTTLIASAGLNQAIRNIDLTAVGAVQVRDWRSTYVQLRASHRRFFAQGYLNESNTGKTFFLRTGRPIVDKSRLWVAQVQHGADLGAHQSLTYGLDAQRTEPRTAGTIHGRNEDSDIIRELGAYVHSSTQLRRWLDLVAALRVDDHSRFDDPVVSPRAGLLFKPADRQTIHFTYNRAYGTPGSDDLFADFVADSLPLPFKVRVEGVPKSGFTFRRDCGGPCMRSPFTPAGAGGPGAYLPADATLLWDAVVAILRSQGTDIDSVPAPFASQVGTALRTLNPAGWFDPVSGVTDVQPIRSTITNTVEVGYKGVIGGRIRLAVDGYRTWIEGFIGHLRVITPNAFLEQSSLAAYLANYMSPGAADTLAATITALPLGTITPQEARDPSDLILAVRNFGHVSLWGVDGSAVLALTDRVSLTGAYSWVSGDYFPNLDGVADLALNAPARKGSISLAYRDPVRGLTGEVRLRGADSFPVLSGVYAGEVSFYTLVDAALGCRVPGARAVLFALTAENLFDQRHQEFVGAPSIGRLVLARLRGSF